MPGSGGTKLSSFLHHGLVYKTGDCVLVNPDEAPLPFIGKVKEIVQLSDNHDEIEVTVHWFYRPEEAQGGRKPFHGEREVFSSNHKDTIHKNTIMGRCRVHSLKQYEALEHITDQDFYTRFKYKPVQKEFEPDEVPVYCTCGQPYNPDRAMVYCDTCNDWFHLDCMGIDASTLDRSKIYICPTCAAKAPKRPRLSEAAAPAHAAAPAAGDEDDFSGHLPPSLLGSLDGVGADSDILQLGASPPGAMEIHHMVQGSTGHAGQGISAGAVHVAQGAQGNPAPAVSLMSGYSQGRRQSNNSGGVQQSSGRPAASTLAQVQQQQQQQQQNQYILQPAQHQYVLQPAQHQAVLAQAQQHRQQQQQQQQQQFHSAQQQTQQQPHVQQYWSQPADSKQSAYEASSAQQGTVYSPPAYQQPTYQQPQQATLYVKHDQPRVLAPQPPLPQQQQQQHVHSHQVQQAYIVQGSPARLQVQQPQQHQPVVQQYASTSQGMSYPPGTLLTIHNLPSQQVPDQQQQQQLVQSIPQSTYIVTSLGGHTGSAYAMPSHTQLQVIKSTGTFRAAASVPLGTF